MLSLVYAISWPGTNVKRDCEGPEWVPCSFLPDLSRQFLHRYSTLRTCFPHPNGQLSYSLLSGSDDYDVRNPQHLCISHSLLNGLIRIIDICSDSPIVQFLGDLICIRQEFSCYRYDPSLTWSQPERELRLLALSLHPSTTVQDRENVALNGSNERSMNYRRELSCRVLVNVRYVESLGVAYVDLECGYLSRPVQFIDDMIFNI